MTGPLPRDIDARALHLLDDLMDRDDAGRAQALDELEAESPELHTRVRRLLAASDHDATGDSQLLRRPLADSGWPATAVAAGALQPGSLLGGYRLLRELGRGGMSVVWLAERADGVLKRPVALKLAQLALAPSMLGERFARERDVLAALGHPHIARLLDAGVDAGGQPYIALEYVEGSPIDAWCDAHKLTIDRRLSIFLQVLAAVAHAHQHLVVHRDLKPSNILVDAQGEVKLLDFGIAKLLGDAVDAPQLTQLGGCALTPRYASPEQVGSGVISTMTDVYGLGAVLYELLSGTHPYPGSDGSLAAMVRAVQEQPAMPLGQADAQPAQAHDRGLPDARRLRATLAGDLDTIVRKCLSKEPGRRYTSVEALADDIRRFLARQPITARRPSLAYSLRLFLQRNRAATVSAGLGVIAALAMGTVAWQQYRASSAQTARADAVRDFLGDLMSDAEPDETRAGATVTGKDMVDAAARRLRDQFEDQPRLQAELLLEVGRMYARLGLPEQSIQMLRDAEQLLEKHAPDADPELNKVRANLASLLLQSDKDAAEAMARRAHAACVTRGSECAKARGYASLALSSLAEGRGLAGDALELARRTVQELELGFPQGDATVVDVLDRLASAARKAGRPQEAHDALERALRMSERIRMPLRAADRLRLLRTRALLQMDLGHLAEARRQFEALSKQPADAEERVVQLRLLSNVMAAQGDAGAALETAREAEALVNAADMRTAALVGQARAVAQALSGDATTARGAMQGVIQLLESAGGEAEVYVLLRARRIQGEIRRPTHRPASPRSGRAR